MSKAKKHTVTVTFTVETYDKDRAIALIEAMLEKADRPSIAGPAEGIAVTEVQS